MIANSVWGHHSFICDSVRGSNSLPAIASITVILVTEEICLDWKCTPGPRFCSPCWGGGRRAAGCPEQSMCSARCSSTGTAPVLLGDSSQWELSQGRTSSIGCPSPCDRGLVGMWRNCPLEERKQSDEDSLGMSSLWCTPRLNYSPGFSYFHRIWPYRYQMEFFFFFFFT